MRIVTAALAALTLAASAQGALAADPTAARVLERAAAAMGGKTKLLGLKSLSYEGLGWNANLMQQMSPDSPLLLWMLPTYKRTIDLESGRAAVALVRRPAFPAVFDNAAADNRIDGDVAWNVSVQNGQPTPQRAGQAEVYARRLDVLHHPVTALRAALAPGARLGPVRRSGGEDTVEVTTSTGDRFALSIDVDTGLPSAVSSLRDHVQLGDVRLVTRFSGYEYLQPAAIKLPKRLASTIDRWPDYDIGVMSHALNVDVSALAAPPQVAAAAPAPMGEIQAEELAPGVWNLTGGYRLSSVVIEFADHLAIVEVPGDEARAEALFAKARSLRPGKPLTTAIFTHFHADHAGGFRATVAEGLTVYAHKGNEALFREFARRPKTLSPDALARRPRPLKFVGVDDSLTLKDAGQDVRLIHHRGATHGDTMLLVYLPSPGLLAQGDSWTPGSRIVPHAVQFAEEIDARGLRVLRHIAIDGGQVRPDSEFREVVARLRTGAIN